MSDAAPPPPRLVGLGRLGARPITALAAGAALAAAFAPVSAGWLAPLAIGVLAHLVRARRVRTAFATGYLFGVAHVGVLMFWLADSITPVAWVALSLAVSLWSGVAGVLMSLALRAPGGAWWAAAAWVGVELARQEVPLGGFPWGRVGFTAVDSMWSSLLPYAGVTGAGFVLALLGVLGADAVGSRRLPTVLAVSGVAAASLVPVFVPYTVTPSGSVTVAAVQPGVPGRGNDVLRHHREITQRLLDATVALSADVTAGRQPTPEIVVWPENSTAADPIRDAAARSAIDAAGVATTAYGAQLLVGALVGTDEEGYVVNQGIVWSASGPTIDRYTKHHPVPFGEYVPFRPVLGGVSDLLEAVPRDMLAGTGSQPWQVSGLQVAGAICFDVAFDDVIAPQVRSGAELVVVQTSNAMFIGTPQLEQQLAITRARAAESGRSTVVASINGASALIGPDGQVLQRAPTRGTAVLVGRLMTSSTITPAVRLARPLGLVLPALGVIGPVWALARTRRSRPQSGARRTAGVSVREWRRRRLSL